MNMMWISRMNLPLFETEIWFGKNGIVSTIVLYVMYVYSGVRDVKGSGDVLHIPGGPRLVPARKCFRFGP